ncbi:MAG: DUF4153 domain-containing protein [Oscillibacter sp.]
MNLALAATLALGVQPGISGRGIYWPCWPCCPSTPSASPADNFCPGGVPPCCGSGSVCCCGASSAIWGQHWPPPGLRKRTAPPGGSCPAAGAAGALALLAVLVPALASADALFAAATADLRAFVSLHFTDAVWKALLASVMTPFLFGLLYSLRRPTPLKRTGAAARGGVDGPALRHRAGGGGGAVPAVPGRPIRRTPGGAEYLAQKGLPMPSGPGAVSSRWWGDGGEPDASAGCGPVVPPGGRRLAGSPPPLRPADSGEPAPASSAAWRMTLYVDVYGPSFKRCMTYWGMGDDGGLSAGCGLEGVAARLPVLSGGVSLALAGWLVINCVPVDYLVAKDQVDRYLSGESGVLDAEYLLYDLL